MSLGYPEGAALPGRGRGAGGLVTPRRTGARCRGERAVLPATTFTPGPPSGGQLPPGVPINGQTPPFPSQPVQGVSAILDAGGGEYFAMPDNGFGAKNNSANFLLRVYHVRPSFRGASGGDGTVAVGDFI